MNKSLRNASLSAAILALGCVVGWGNQSVAQDESSVLAPQPAEQPELVPATPPAPLPGPAAPQEELAPQENLAPPHDAVQAHPVARIDYDVTRRARDASAARLSST